MKTKKENIFVGARSTGTDILLKLVNEKDVLLGEGRAGPANICFSVKDAWHSINEAFQQALDEAMISKEKLSNYAFHAGIGIKGTELEENCIAFTSTPHNFTTLILQSDGYVDCLGAHNGKDGSAIVVDEGVVAYLIEGGKYTKLGGWGFPHADEGSAAWLGLEAVRHTLQWQDGHISKSPLLQHVLQRFNNNLSQIVAWATRATPRQYASLVNMVIEFANKENPDTNAIKLMKKAANHIERTYELLYKKAKNKNLPCCLFGGIAENIEPWLHGDMKKKLIKPHADGATGGVLMVKKDFLKEKH